MISSGLWLESSVGASILLQALTSQESFLSWSGGPQQSPGTELASGAQREPLPPAPPAPPSPACLMPRTSALGLREPGTQRIPGLSPPIPPGFGRGPPPRPLPELWVEKPALRSGLASYQVGRASSPRSLSGRRGHPHISKVQCSGAPPGGRGSISSLAP